MTGRAEDIARGLTGKHRALLGVGEQLRLYLPWRKTKREVWQGVFRPPVLIDSSYLDFDSLDDPIRSDMPAMKQLEARGLVRSEGPPRDKFFKDSDGIEWAWTLTPLGREVAALLRSPE